MRRCAVPAICVPYAAGGFNGEIRSRNRNNATTALDVRCEHALAGSRLLCCGWRVLRAFLLFASVTVSCIRFPLGALTRVPRIVRYSPFQQVAFDALRCGFAAVTADCRRRRRVDYAG
jgi:hypothetical protein